jgi:hypothetical protein
MNKKFNLDELKQACVDLDIGESWFDVREGRTAGTLHIGGSRESWHIGKMVMDAREGRQLLELLAALPDLIDTLQGFEAARSPDRDRIVIEATPETMEALRQAITQHKPEPSGKLELLSYTGDSTELDRLRGWLAKLQHYARTRIVVRDNSQEVVEMITDALAGKPVD